jgi:CubicO group peptidase (beta-lactamase class C family)
MLTLKKERLVENLTNRIDKDISEGTLIGASCAVIQDGQRVAAVIKGVSDPVTNEPLREDSIFRIASMTKLITIAGLLRLIEQGKLSYNTPVSDFFPGFKSKRLAHIDVDYTQLKSLDDIKGKPIIIDGESKAPMTIHHLVTHTNGLGSGLAGMAQISAMPHEMKGTLKSIVDFYEREAVLDFEPGSYWAYSGLAAFDVIGRIIEILSGLSYEEYIKLHILDPLGMVDTAFNPTVGQRSRMVSLHNVEDGKVTTMDFGDNIIGDLPPTNPVPGGGLVSTIGDFCNFITMLLGKGQFNGKQVLSAESVQAMGTQRIPDDLLGVKPGMTWGVGCTIYKDFPPMPPGCFGWSGAWGTHMWVDPTHRIGAIYMRNSYFAGGAEAVTARTFEKDVYAAAE